MSIRQPALGRVEEPEAPKTFLDKRRDVLRPLVGTYGGDESDLEYYLQMWVKGRIRQVDIEMIMAKDFGATSDEIADLHGYRGGNQAQVAINGAKKKARAAGFEFKEDSHA